MEIMKTKKAQNQEDRLILARLEKEKIREQKRKTKKFSKYGSFLFGHRTFTASFWGR
jgi:CCR4-NOT transcriptional regulation complex NOT5 subunit